ncbi:Coatomer subunit zeta-2, partial [Sciurus carolinensis]|nr:Coatomer subunit zeta-2 [Sciurus carolinensis]
PRCQLQEPSLYTIKAVFILDNDGRRLLAKYYDDTFPSMKEQMVFEKNVFNKTSRTESEIAFFGGMTIVYKSSIDLFLYVVGSSHENELMLMSVLTCLFESLSHMLRKNVEKRWLLENMDGAFLVLDEIVDGGVILESDPQQVIQKVNFRADDSSLTEQSVTQVRIQRNESDRQCRIYTVCMVEGHPSKRILAQTLPRGYWREEGFAHYPAAGPVTFEGEGSNHLGLNCKMATWKAAGEQLLGLVPLLNTSNH